MKPGGRGKQFSPGHRIISSVASNVNVDCSNDQSSKSLLILNSLVKKSYTSWLKPIHTCIRSTLSKCITAASKSKSKSCKHSESSNDSAIETSTESMHDLLNNECLNNSACDNNCNFVSDDVGITVCNSKLRECSFDENELNVCNPNDVIESNKKEQLPKKPIVPFLNSCNLSLVNRLSVQETDYLRKELAYMQQVTNTFEVGSVPFIRVVIFDKVHNFCIDSGAAVSVLGRDMLLHVDKNQLQEFLFQLNTANRMPVKVYGKLNIPFRIGDYSFDHEFVFADVDKNFLGSDFLRRYNIWLNVDKGIHIRDVNRCSTIEMELSVKNDGELFLSSINSTQNFISAYGVEDIVPEIDNVSIVSPNLNENYLNDDSSTESETESSDELQQPQVINNILTNLDNTYADYHLHKKDVISKESEMNNNEFSINDPLIKDTLEYLRNEYSSVFSGEISLKSKHNINMQIEINGQFKRPYIYTVPYCYKKAVRERIDELMSKGILRRSSSEFMNPITVVPKKDGSVRVCGDYRVLNSITRSDCFTLPRIDYIKSHIKGNVFTTLDLKDGFFQVPMHPDSISKTAIYTEFGLFEFVRMPFGLKNAPAVFQRFIDHVFDDLRAFTHVYIDDVIIFSNSIAEHIKHLESVISRLSDFGLIIQERKCSFFLNKIHYLGFEFNESGYRPLPRVIPQFNSYPVPTDRKSVQKFLGAVNFYRSHIPDLADIAVPLYDLLQKKTKFYWSASCQKSFELLCKILSTRITLVPFNDEGDIVLQTDASSVALGAVLLQNGKPVEFYSRKLSSVEQRYPTYEREASAMVSAMLHFRPFLIGHKFELHTDHRPLLAWRNKMPESKRQARLWVKVQDLDYIIKYIPGEQNILADFMSRPPGEEVSSLMQLHNDCTLNGIALSVLTPELKEAQQKDNFIKSCNIHPDSLEFIDEFAYITDKGYPRLVIPPDFRHDLVSSIHCLGHFGRRRTLKAVSRLYWWKGMPSYVANFVKYCQSCQRNKPCKKAKRQPIKFFATARFKIVHLDFVGPFKSSSKGNNYLFTMLDRYSRWIEAIPMRDPTAQSCAQVFISSWVCRHGIPEAILTDQGGQFESQLFNEVISKFGITRSRTTAYHPETNGALERAHATLKNCLRCLIDQFQDWEDRLPLALFAMRTAIFDSDLSPAMILYGEQLNVPGSFLSVDPMMFQDDMSLFMTNLATRLNEIRTIILESQQPIENENNNNDDIVFKYPYCYVKDPIKRSSLEPKWLGPFKVLHANGPLVRLNINGVEKNINVDRIKPAFVLSSYFNENSLIETELSPSFLYPEENFEEFTQNPYVDEFQQAIENQPVVMLERNEYSNPTQARRSQRLIGQYVEYTK